MKDTMKIEKNCFANGHWVQGTVALLLMLASLTVSGQEVVELGEIVVVGSRFGERSVADSPVPVDVVSGEELVRTGQSELGRAIQVLIPSFNFSSSTISDGTDSVRPATLRGMGPDQVLVLVNGKRRHGSALIHVNTSVGRGTAGTDMNAIPVHAIERVEVLRDGASAQYGSDAVAGVINIVLKEDYEGTLRGLYGSTFHGDGERRSVGVNKGFALGNDGVLHLALEYNERDRTNRAGKSAQIQYPDTVLCAAGDTDCTFVEGVQTIKEDPGNKERDFERRNFRIGDAEQEHFVSSLNLVQPIMDDWGELYGFANYSRSTNLSGGFYRRANQGNRNPVGSIYPDGFLPRIDTTVQDYSMGAGIHREFENGLTVDFSIVHGGNTFEFDIRNSQNASWVNRMLNPGGTYPAFPGTEFTGATQTSADSGELGLDLTTVNLDFTIPYRRADIAWGAEYRRDRYEIDAGELYSYADYDGEGGGDGGIQVFPGFQPGNEVSETRHAESFYVDTDIQVNDKLQLGLGLRYEDYSDFGDTLNGKIASKLDLNETLSFRASVSSGFRAPSMQQIYFNNISTQFRGGQGFQVGTFRNDGPLAKAIGIPELDEEESINFSGGFVFQPSPSLALTADLYRIEVDDRIIVSGQLTVPGAGQSSELSDSIIASLKREGVSRAQFFMNGVDTVTEGADIVITWDVPYEIRGDLTLQLLGSWTDTEIDSVNLPAGLPASLFTDLDRSIIEDWQPKNRAALTALYRLGKFSASASVQRYGNYRIAEEVGGEFKKQSYDSELITDVQMSYEVGPGMTFKLGADNLFDNEPDKDKISRSRAGTIVDAEGNTVVSSDGVFTYSRRAAPFGFNGGFYYATLEYQF